MSHWRHARFRSQSGELSMTSMIDVVFLLLIFFVCTASFQAAELILPSNLSISGSSSIEIELEPPDDLEEIVLEVTPDGESVVWKVNERICGSRAELRDLLAAYAEVDRSLPVIVDCHDQVPLAEAISSYDLARSVGLAKVQFAAPAE